MSVPVAPPPPPPHAPLRRGPAAGGPQDGQVLTSQYRSINVPVFYRGAVLAAQGRYVFKEVVGMWIWEGAWPPSNRR